MSEPSASFEASVPALQAPSVESSAGSLLRSAREAQGLEIEMLAALLKVHPRKLEALEADQWEGVSGLSFERALAQAACRALKLDPAGVLARLPRPESHPLDRVGGGLNAPFREHGGKLERGDEQARRFWVWMGLAVLALAATALWLLPQRGGGIPEWWANRAWSASEPPPPAKEQRSDALPVPPASSLEAPGVSALPAPVSLGGRTSGSDLPVGAASGVAVAPLPAAATVPVPAPLVVRVRAESWVEVIDATGKALVARNVAAGEALSLDGVLPLQVKIGNAAATEVLFRGDHIDLSTQSKDNVARLELK